MQNKLQELTDRLYNEGLSKGKQEGEAIVQEARSKADAIVSDARRQAEEILAKAKKDAEELKSKVNGDLKMAASQCISATRQDIEKLIITKMTDKEIKTALSSADFIKSMIMAVAEKFSTDEPAGLDIILPESLKKEVEPFVEKELSSILKSGVTASFSKKISGGFAIGPKDGGYFISFSDETFTELISEYLRPATKKLLFG